MKPRERAEAVAKIFSSQGKERARRILEVVERAISDAVDEEREVCARIAENGCRCDDARTHIAESIRNRDRRLCE